MRRLVCPSDSVLSSAIVAGLPPDVELIAGDGDLERIVSALRTSPVEVLWDLAAEWLSSNVVRALSDEQIRRSRWLWLPESRRVLRIFLRLASRFTNCPSIDCRRLYPRWSASQPEIRGHLKP